MAVPAPEDAAPVTPEAPAATGSGSEARPIPNRGLDAYHGYQADRAALAEVLMDIEAIGGDRIARKTAALRKDIYAFAPAITMIGQVKAGKTMLVNAMAGRPGMLPSDVNPWTSVVTSLHLGHPREDDAARAAFRFFDADEWDRLVKNGGRIGELAGRTGADREMEELRTQVAEMREKTRDRLGKRFELMLGQTHDYARFDESLIKRYVCMGDDFDAMSIEERQGQFADITRSAELWLDEGALPVPVTIRDTPGVNDTFMMREQITIRALRDSRTCVVVLSAHQALNTTDMGLIRLISTMKSRDVILFVNRVDELSDPATQIPEIEASLTATLEGQVEGTTPQVIFGSAYWATSVLDGSLDGMVPESAKALLDLASGQQGRALTGLPVQDIVWELSGLPALHAAIGDRLTQGPWARHLADLRRRAGNYVAGLRASSSVVTLHGTGDDGTVQKMPQADVDQLIAGIEGEARQGLETKLDSIFTKFSARVDQVHNSFLDRALAELLEHLEAHGDKAVWSYSPDGLRLLIRSAYQVMRRNFTRDVGGLYTTTATQLTAAYGRIFEVEATNFELAVPDVPETPQPTALAQTIALDLKTSWWKSWWGKRRGYRAFSQDFRALIEAETAPMVDELKIAQAEDIRARARHTLEEFLTEQRDVLTDMSAKSQVSIEELNGLFGVTAQEEREQLFEMLMDELDIDEDGDEDIDPFQKGPQA
ncbi:MAG: dynamin family protein [Pseudomonadota bacterium]